METYRCVQAERAFLSAMGGGCQLAVAAYAEIIESELRLRGVSFLKGAARRSEARGDIGKPEAVGEQLARELQK
jgi:hydroxymethylbilane synthase